MTIARLARVFAGSALDHAGKRILIRGWVFRLRSLANTTFIVVRDCTGDIQCVMATERFKALHLKLDDAVELTGQIRIEARAKAGCEMDIDDLRVLNSASHKLPFNSSSKLASVGVEARVGYRPLTCRNNEVGNIFRIQAAALRYFREFLEAQHFQEIITSKIVSSGTEGGSNLFAIKYFEQTAYLAQSPQFYKEHGVAAFERVFETGHVYRAEPHASSRHLTEYYSLDLEFGFIDGPEDVIELERQLLTFIFEKLNHNYGDTLRQYRSAPLPSMRNVPVWDFHECLERLALAHGTSHLKDDLDPEAERQLCALACAETGVPAVFVLGFPAANRPFYSAPRGDSGAAQSFDLLLDGLEITTGGQRLPANARRARNCAQYSRDGSVRVRGSSTHV